MLCSAASLSISNESHPSVRLEHGGNLVERLWLKIRGGVDNQVQSVCILFFESFFVSCNEMIGTDLRSKSLLAVTSRNGGDLSTKGLGKHNCHVANTTNTRNTNLGSLFHAVGEQWTESSNTSAKHWGGVLAGKTFWNWDGKSAVHTDVGSVSTLNKSAVWVRVQVKMGSLTTAVGFMVVTSVTFTTGVTLSSNTNSLADLVFGAINLITKSNNLSNNFVTESSWNRNITPVTLTRMQVRSTDTARDDLDVDVLWSGLVRLVGERLSVRPVFQVEQSDSFEFRW
ncbi:hypothetical protein OGAPHI_004933 [Ogataea philodendri]|uniref:Uncharacterized protein n=1 Tax=Ogataea philodendri TaxID=1378263 RepID=A0A9P8P1P4_9ASCO|nr:uncharacterized protein OGAPHI_004933 [Ogataea philodendri]KAH3663532.1 hypothetical protein OGAPHI_004933 [Ogataea philodendri]